MKVVLMMAKFWDGLRFVCNIKFEEFHLMALVHTDHSYFRHTIMNLYKLFVVTMLFLCHLAEEKLSSNPLNISSLLNTPGLDYHHWG